MATRAPICAALAIATACALAPATAAAESSCAGAETEAAELGVVALEQSVLCVINEQRGAAGIPPVRSNPKLVQAAAKHSSDMVQYGFFSHTSPGGGSFIDRISATGYMRGARSWLVGENLVWGTSRLSTPASMVDAWMDSPPHRANLLRGRFREIGLSGVFGTPNEATDGNGITVTSEYGTRDVKKKRARKTGRRARKTGLRARAHLRSRT
jgi:uncharacterized protein YkwD